MTRPFIAVPAIRSPRIAGLRRSGVVAADKICEAIFRAGGDPFLLPPGDAIHDRLRFAHGAVVPGGSDLDPATYGQTRDEGTEDTDRVQDAYDIAFTTALLDLQVPFLAICRGMQVLNVALGGTLDQHICSREGGVSHGLPGVEGGSTLHPVRVQGGSRLARALGTTRAQVCSHHHQAVEKRGVGLEAVAWADDGIVEGIELTDGDSWVVGAQWHPEDTAATDPVQQRLFDAFVDQARAGA